MAKNELKPIGRHQVGFGFTGSRLKLSGGSILRGSGNGKPPVIIQPMVPSEVGVQQARSQLVAQQMHKEAVRGLVRKRRSAATDKKKKTKYIKKAGQKSKRHSVAGKQSRKKGKQKKKTLAASRRTDNFS
jgi:hypothetical protein